MEVNGEALQLHAVYKITASHTRSVLNNYKSCENSYQVLQVTRKSLRLNVQLICL